MITKRGLTCLTADEMRELYRTDPGLFDRLAAEAIEQACIGDTPGETLRLRQMQQTIDAQLQKAKNQLERTRIMEIIFYSNVFGSDGNLARIIDSWVELAHPAEMGKVPDKKPVLMLVKK